MIDWISVRDRMPDPHKRVLVYDRICGVCTDFIDHYFSKGDSFFYNTDVTYWMPLPEPPETDIADEA